MAADVPTTPNDGASENAPRLGLRAGDLIVDLALVRSEDDEFGHGAIADRVAEIAGTQPMPLRIALYGPWGSGKSSQLTLLKGSLKQSAPKSRLIRYDASTFGGKALQRNFITRAATELDVPDDDTKDHKPYHRGLYEKSRHTTVDFKRAANALGQLGVITIVVFGSLLLTLCLLAGLGSYLTPKNPWHQIAASLPQFIAPAALAAVIVAIGKAALDGGRIETEEDTPSEDEEFARRLDALLDFVARRDGTDRFVFFIDELDRCAADDIVSTLGALRTLLDNKRCVFIVAADRAVLERALGDLPQVTPINSSDPYYSSAGSYFDKVFQHSLELPPLRDQRLFNFAVRLVDKRSGVWLELRDGDDPTLQRVLYTLIPSHVRSPRRVKHLLNHFATSVRTIEARGLEWRERAAEIAKLSVLRVEFPVLAADLLREPRLPSMLIDPPEKPTARVSELLAKHSPAQAHRAGRALPEYEPPDQPLVDAPQALLDTEQRNLMRYLHRVASVGVRDPGRDLLYLELAGVDVGLDDTELAEILESDAVDRPDEAVAAIEERSPDQRDAAVAVLAAMADGARGDERTNVIRTLMQAAELVADVPVSAVDAILGYDAEEGLYDTDLPVALNLALRAKSQPLVDQLFRREALLEGPQLPLTAATAGELAEPRQEQVTDAVEARFAVEPREALAAVDALPDALAASVLKSNCFRDALRSSPGTIPDGDPEVLRPFLRGGVALVSERPLTAVAASWVLLTREGAYDEIRAHASAILAALEHTGTRQERSSHALVALRLAPEEDVPIWLAGLEPQPKPWERQGDRACEAIVAQLGHYTGRAALSELGTRLAPFIACANGERQGEVVAAFIRQLAARNWWDSDATRVLQEQLHEAAHAIAAQMDAEQAAALRDSLPADLLRVRGVDPAALVAIEAWETYGALGRRLDPARAEQLLQAGFPSDLPGETTAGVLLAEVRIRSAAGRLGDLAIERLRSGLGTKANVAAIGEWLGQPATGPQVAALALMLGASTPTGVLRATETWANDVAQAQRDAAVSDLLAAQLDGDGWIRAVRSAPVDEERLVGQVHATLAEATREQQRQALAAAISCRPLVQVEARRALVAIIETLLASGKAGDFRIACSLVPILGQGHRGGRRLHDAFASATSTGPSRIPATDADAFEAVGVRPPKAAFQKQSRSRGRSIRDRLGL